MKQKQQINELFLPHFLSSSLVLELYLCYDNCTWFRLLFLFHLYMLPFCDVSHWVLLRFSHWIRVNFRNNWRQNFYYLPSQFYSSQIPNPNPKYLVLIKKITRRRIRCCALVFYYIKIVLSIKCLNYCTSTTFLYKLL